MHLLEDSNCPLWASIMDIAALCSFSLLLGRVFVLDPHAEGHQLIARLVLLPCARCLGGCASGLATSMRLLLVTPSVLWLVFSARACCEHGSHVPKRDPVDCNTHTHASREGHVESEIYNIARYWVLPAIPRGTFSPGRSSKREHANSVDSTHDFGQA